MIIEKLQKIIGRLQKLISLTRKKELPFRSYRIPKKSYSKPSLEQENILLEMKEYLSTVGLVDGNSAIWTEEINNSIISKFSKSLLDGELEKALFFLENAWLLDTGRLAAVYTEPLHGFKNKAYSYFVLQEMINDFRKIEGVSLKDLTTASNIGNPDGFFYGQRPINTTSVRHTYDAISINRLANNRNILEIGGGHGSLAANLYKKTSFKGKYINIDLPPMLCVAYYYLRTTFPHMKVALLNVNATPKMAQELFEKVDVMLVGAQDFNSIDTLDIAVAFNSYSLSEMSLETVQAYVELIDKLRVKFFLHENYSGQGGVNHSLVASGYFKFSSLVKIQKLLILPEVNRRDCVRELYTLSSNKV